MEEKVGQRAWLGNVPTLAMRAAREGQGRPGEEKAMKVMMTNSGSAEPIQRARVQDR